MTPDQAQILSDQVLQAESMLDAVREPWWVWTLTVLGVVGIWMLTVWWESRKRR